MLPLPHSLAIVDVETTGGSPAGHRVIEVGVARIEPDGRIERFSTLVNPGRPVSQFILALTGIRRDELESAPRFDEIAPGLQAFLKDAVFVAHNARFDYAFLKSEFARLGVSFTARTVCSARLSRALYPEHRRHDLSTLIERWDLKCEKRHRALDDALAVLEFFEKASAERGAGRFEAAFKKLLSKRIEQCGVPAETLRTLPEAPGVYVLLGEKKDVLYVGKSKNLRDRVLSHLLGGDEETGKSLGIASRVTDVEVHRTPGELSALLLESDLVKKLKPVFNRRLKARKEFVLALKEATAEGYDTVRLTASPEIAPERGGLLGIFTGLAQAKDSLYETAKTWKLCPKLLRLQPSGDVCFSYHLKNCGGACAGEEAPESYNARFAAAFPPVIRKWPYRSAVLVEERDAADGSGEAFVVDDWRITARIRFTEAGEDTKEIDRPFDLDTYKILRRAFEAPYGTFRVTPLTHPAVPEEFADAS